MIPVRCACLFSFQNDFDAKVWAQVEKMKEAAQLDEDARCASHHQKIVGKHAELEACIQSQLEYLDSEVLWAKSLLSEAGQGPEEVPSTAVGPVNGRDAALAIATL